MDLADGLETGSPYIHLHCPDLVLSLGAGSPHCGSSPFEREPAAPGLLRSMLHYGHSRFII